VEAVVDKGISGDSAEELISKEEEAVNMMEWEYQAYGIII
jgi:hypothetical protein